ncbi:MAG: prenyltransferase/squalene oxidase repeat-containing protein [Phycisphaerae bacterium]
MSARLATALFALLTALAEPAPAADARAAVVRALPFLETHGVAWIRDRGCTSCHQTTFLVWAHNQANRRGVPVDAVKLDGWTSWAMLSVVTSEDQGLGQGADTLSQLLIGRDPAAALTAKPAKGSRNFDPYENVLRTLLKSQAADGHWTAGGQSRNPPDAPTGWALHAIALRQKWMAGPKLNPAAGAADALKKLIKANDDAIPAARDRALAFLQKSKEDPAADLTEQLVTRLLVEIGYGTPARITERTDALLARQNPDGGWSASPKLKRPSDAYATGHAIYTLSLAGRPPTDPAIKHATAFLLITQSADGSWPVPSTAFHPGEKPTRADRTTVIYSYWGTAWATIGLLQSLPTK